MRDTSTLTMDSHADPMGLLQQIIEIATTSSTPELLVGRLAKTLGVAFQAGGCVVAFLNPPTAPIELGCWVASQSDLPTQTLSLLQEHFRQQLLAVSNTTRATDLPSPAATATVVRAMDTAWQLLRLPAPLSTAATVLEFPIQFQGVPRGAISLVRSQLHLWTTTEITRLNIFGQQIAATFAQMQLQHHVHKQLQYQEIVNQLTLSIRSTPNLADVLKLAISGTAQVLQVQRGMLLRLKYADPLFRTTTVESVPKARVTLTSEWTVPPNPTHLEAPLPEPLMSDEKTRSFWLSECALCQQTFNSPHPLAINAKHQWHCHTPENQATQCLDIANANALLIARLESQGTILGFLLFQDSHPRVWEQADIDLVDLVAAQVSNAIMQTETLRQVQSLVEKRTAELQQSLTIQAKLYERTRQQLEQLRRLNQLKDEFLDTVSHELRTPLTSMALAIRMLRQVGTDGDRSLRYLDILEQQCAQETSLVNDLLDLQELESKQVAIQLEEIDLVKLVEELGQSFYHRWHAEGLSLELEFPEHPVKIRSDRDSLSRILVELLTNAGKYSTPNHTIQLQLIYRREVPTNQIILSLCNIGSGIPPEELPYIFEKFRRCQGATQNAIQGTGLGLALVKSLVQHLNGTISASSTPLENSTDWETCFSLILPQTFDGAGNL